MNHFAAGIAVVLILSGCATNKYCERSQREYENVVESAPLKPAEGMSVPAPDPNLAIPQATGPQVPFATKEPDAKQKGGKHTSCLDAPPSLAPEQDKSKPEASS